MEFATVVARRRMVRRYDGRPVDPAVLERILDSARRGPSAGFSQGQYFVAVTEEATRRVIAELCREPEFVSRGFPPWLSLAPVHVIPCVREADYHDRYADADKGAPQRPAGWEVPYWWVDAGAALMLLLLAAVDEGLGAGFLDLADPSGVRDLLGIPADVAPLGLVTLGHPAPEGRTTASITRGRRPARQVVRYERW